MRYWWNGSLRGECYTKYAHPSDTHMNSSASCQKLILSHEVLLIISQGITICMSPYSIIHHVGLTRVTHLVLFIVRTYSLYNKSRRVVVFLSTVAMAGGVLGGVNQFLPHYHLNLRLLTWSCDQWAIMQTMHGVRHPSKGEHGNHKGCTHLLPISE